MANFINPSGALQLLSSMYLCKPSPEAVTGWTSLLGADTPGLLDDLKGALRGIDTTSDGTMEDLLWDYTRLFVGPYKLPCPPWESVYTSQKKLMMQDAADEVKKAYAEFGLILDDPAVMPDHVGAELNFLALVYERADGEAERPSDGTRIGEAFLNDHLMKWVPRFTEDMEMAAEAMLYKTLARTTRNALKLLSA